MHSGNFVVRDTLNAIQPLDSLKPGGKFDAAFGNGGEWPMQVKSIDPLDRTLICKGHAANVHQFQL